MNVGTKVYWKSQLVGYEREYIITRVTKKYAFSEYKNGLGKTFEVKFNRIQTIGYPFYEVKKEHERFPSSHYYLKQE